MIAASTAAVVLLIAPHSALAQTYGYLPGFGPEFQESEQLEVTPRQQARAEEDRYDEYLLTAEVKEFMTLVQQKDSPSEDALAAARLKLGLARAPSGRVSVRSYTGEWFNIKPDSQAAGVLVLQNSSGYCFVLPRDPGNKLIQLDLSDDLVFAQLFSNMAWEDLLQPISRMDGDSGKPEPLILTNAEFRDTEDFQLFSKAV